MQKVRQLGDIRRNPSRQSKKFRISVEKLPSSRRGIGAMTSRISDMGNHWGQS
jgi:hypothetical protein